MNSFSVTKQFHITKGRKARKIMKPGAPSRTVPGNTPRVSRLMALAIRFNEMIRAGHIADQAEVARVGYVSRARITQLMNLLSLAPDIQEEILYLPKTTRGRDPVRETHLRPLTKVPCWGTQRKMWKKLLRIQMGSRPEEHEEG